MTVHIYIHQVRDNANRKTIIKKENKKGTVFALIRGDESWEVWRLAENYNGAVKGGLSKTWRYVEKGLTEEKAKQLFDRRIQGTQQ